MFPNLSPLAGDKECELLIDSLSLLFVQENNPTLKGRVHQSEACEMQRFYREYYKLLPQRVSQILSCEDYITNPDHKKYFDMLSL